MAVGSTAFVAYPSVSTVSVPRLAGRILKVPPKLAAGSRQNSQAGGVRYVAQPSRLRVRGASEPHVPSHRQPTDGGNFKMHPTLPEPGISSCHLFAAWLISKLKQRRINV